jgi:hypothetical protein
VEGQFPAMPTTQKGAIDMAKVICVFNFLCVFLDDPADPRDDKRVIYIRPGDPTIPTQRRIDLLHGALQGLGFVTMAASYSVKPPATCAAPRSCVPVPITR